MVAACWKSWQAAPTRVQAWDQRVIEVPDVARLVDQPPRQSRTASGQRRIGFGAQPATAIGTTTQAYLRVDPSPGPPHEAQAKTFREPTGCATVPGGPPVVIGQSTVCAGATTAAADPGVGWAAFSAPGVEHPVGSNTAASPAAAAATLRDFLLFAFMIVPFSCGCIDRYCTRASSDATAITR